MIVQQIIKSCFSAKKVALISLSFLLCQQAWGHFQGEMVAAGGSSKIFSLDVKDLKLKNEVGDIRASSWNFGGGGGNYAVMIYCPDYNISNSGTNIENQQRYYTAVSSMVPSAKNPYYLHLNKYIDVKVEIKVVKNKKEVFMPVPFENVGNGVAEDFTCQRELYDSYSTTTGASGKLTFIVTEPFINGTNLAGTQVAELYGRSGKRFGYGGIGISAATPLVKIEINSGTIRVEDECEVNEGQEIIVDFDEPLPASGDLINKSNRKKVVPIRVQCKGGSFAKGVMAINMAIQPGAEGMDATSNYLATDKANLWMSLKDADKGNPLKPNEFLSVDLQDVNNNGEAVKRGHWNLEVSPIAKPGETISTGEFKSNATVISEFQ